MFSLEYSEVQSLIKQTWGTFGLMTNEIDDLIKDEGDHGLKNRLFTKSAMMGSTLFNSSPF